jgi:hypothetical protein
MEAVIDSGSRYRTRAKRGDLGTLLKDDIIIISALVTSIMNANSFVTVMGPTEMATPLIGGRSHTESSRHGHTRAHSGAVTRFSYSDSHRQIV